MAPAHVAPVATPAASSDGPKAKDVFKNVKVLGDLSVGEFTRLMTAMTAWVSPEQGCGYCHNLENLADDSKYTKVVARRMTQMTQHVNADWKSHVGATGVTCYTCHRGKNVPENVWFAPEPNRRSAGLLGDDAGQNKAATSVALASLPYDPFTPYISKASASTSADIRVIGTTALPTGNLKSTKQAEHTYGLMMHLSQSLGVNCTYCHNTRSFAEWDQSPPQRATAWHGLRMVGDLNSAYMQPLQPSFPANRLGPTGDVAKANCATCHQGVNKPLGGLAMAKDWPGLLSTAAQAPLAAAAPVAVPAAATAPVVAAPLAEPLKAVMYFPVNSPLLKVDEGKKLDALIAAMNARQETTATISGYHSATGKLAANQQLAKQRAFKIRDTLIAGGVAQSRIRLDKPQQTEANIKGEDPFARRVEVTVK
jgi:photosynthetic reaction center cytochrome c subunit